MSKEQLSIPVPGWIQDETETAEQALRAKNDLAEVFTAYLQSDLFTERPPARRVDFVELFRSLNEVIDRSFIQQVEQKAGQLTKGSFNANNSHS